MSQHIAIVEDEPAIRENYADAFRRAGYRVSTFAGRREALDAFEARLPDLVVIDVSLGAQVDDMVEAYRMLYPERTFSCERPAHPCLLDGAPDLIAQLLDKLVENAVDFAPPGAPVAIALEDRGRAWRLSVANPGSRLPPGTPERLFDSLVSERPDGLAPHLGLGLFIVRLIAEHHQGRATARNLPGEDGVEFTIELPKAAAGELRG